jgi:hypothetical protein
MCFPRRHGMLRRVKESARPIDLTITDEELMASCRLEVFKASGPGGQHRNKVSSAVRLRHTPTGVTAEASESRSQHENRRKALGRLRMHIACQLRNSFDPHAPLPQVMVECIFTPKGAKAYGAKRLEVGRRDVRFWAVAAVLLDALDAAGGRLSDVAGWLNITTGNLSKLLKVDRHLLTAANSVRHRQGQKSIV